MDDAYGTINNPKRAKNGGCYRLLLPFGDDRCGKPEFAVVAPSHMKTYRVYCLKHWNWAVKNQSGIKLAKILADRKDAEEEWE